MADFDVWLAKSKVKSKVGVYGWLSQKKKSKVGCTAGQVKSRSQKLGKISNIFGFLGCEIAKFSPLAPLALARSGNMCSTMVKVVPAAIENGLQC